MRSIARVLAVPAVGSGYCDDLAALQAGPIPLAQRFTSAPVTPGFRAVRELAEAVSIGLQLDDGRVAWGDCVGVAYGAGSGRDALFRSEHGLATIRETVAPALEGRALTGFRDLAGDVDALVESVEVTRRVSPETGPIHKHGVSRRDLLTAPARVLQVARGDGEERVAVQQPLHSALRYGLSQALLGAVALARGVTMAEVIAKEWHLPRPGRPISIHAQSGGERYHNAEKMIVRRLASLPHALVDHIPEQLGRDGEQMTLYIRWLKERIGQLAGKVYCPTIHLDLHGTLGQIYDNQLGRILGQLYAWQLAAAPYPLRIESPVVMESSDSQIETMRTLREYVRQRKMDVQLVADEWANTLDDIRAFVAAKAADMIQIKMPDLGGVHNTVEAVLACRAGGVAPFLGGSYVETALSSKVSVHVALATQPALIMAKPGMGVDEAVSLVQNEMARTLAEIEARQVVDGPAGLGPARLQSM